MDERFSLASLPGIVGNKRLERGLEDIILALTKSDLVHIGPVPYALLSKIILPRWSKEFRGVALFKR